MRWLTKLLGTEGATGPEAAKNLGGQRIDDWMREAFALHQAGKTSEAEARYQQILRAQPGNVDALYLLGEIACRSGRHERAIELIGKAIDANGSVAQFHHELGTALRESGDLQGAERSLARAIELAPDDLQSLTTLGDLQLAMGNNAAAEQSFRELRRRAPGLLAASVNLGSALMAQNRLEEAEERLKESLVLDPFCVQALSNLGVISFKKNEIDEARRLLERALEFDPLCFEARVNLAAVLQEQHEWGKALQIIEETVRIRPADPHVRYILGRAHWQRGAYAAAEQALREVVRLAPERIDAAIDLGKILYESGHAAGALEHIGAVLALYPGAAMAHVFRGFVLETMGEFGQAMECYERALALDPQMVQAHVNRGVLRILGGDFEHGWPEYEWRMRIEEVAGGYQRFPLQRWDGTSLAERTLLVNAEQGIGDMIMYGSCFPDAVAQAGHCVIECPGKLVSLFARSFPQATVRNIAGVATEAWLRTVPPVDVQVPAGSLPLHFRRKAADFPRAPYLKADPSRTGAWAARLASLGPGLKVGLSWRGGVPLNGSVYRSIPLERLLAALRHDGISFVSLQYGNARADLDRAARDHAIEVHHWQEAIDDYEETAALVCALDLTISVCTAVVHLGVALGRPVWALAPVRPEARYGMRGDSMPWYGSVRMFRQPAFGDWDSAIANAARALAELAARTPPQASRPAQSLAS